MGVPTGLAAQAVSVCLYRQLATQWREGFWRENEWGLGGGGGRTECHGGEEGAEGG